MMAQISRSRSVSGLSSARPPFLATGRLGNPLVDGAFFHTLEEDSPSIRIDLQRTRTLGRVELVNRTNCCKERARPLVVETSTDGETFEVVARSTETFETFEARFVPREARFVRVRIEGRKDYLHLAAVRIYGP